jgi:SAM-dependent methyltransferase
MKIYYSYGKVSKEAAKVWLEERGWKPSRTAREICNDLEKGMFHYGEPGNGTFKKGMTLCDIGGAHGRDCLHLSKAGFSAILVDPNIYSLEYTREKMKQEGAYFALIEGVLPYLPLADKSVDIVEFRGALHHIPYEHQLDALNEINRIMKPNGILYSMSYGNFGKPPPKKALYPLEKFDAFRELHNQAGFEILRSASYDISGSTKENPESIMWNCKFFKR